MNLREKVLGLVRGMDDDELWEFLQPQLLGDELPVAGAVTGKRGPGRPKKVITKGGDEEAEAAPKKAKKEKKAKASGSNGVSDLQKKVAKYVLKSGGCSVSDVAGKLGEDKVKVAATLKALVEANEIAKAGERRFTRYGGNAKEAKAASLAARGK